MCCCVIETSLVHPWKSLAFFRNLWQYSQVFGKCLKTFAWSSITSEESSKIFGKCSEIFGKSSQACSYNKQNNTWLLVDMEVLFLCSTLYLMSYLCSIMRYQVEHTKRNSISIRTHVLSSISFTALASDAQVDLDVHT